jgi:hypothetical protein
MDVDGTGILSSRVVIDGVIINKKITNLKSKDVKVDYKIVKDFFLKIYDY